MIKFVWRFIGLYAALVTAAVAQNLVQDPGFEKAGTGTAGSWNLQNTTATGGVVVRIDTALAHSGSRSLLLDQTHPLVLPDGATTASNLVRFIQANKTGGSVSADQTVPAEGGKTYNLSFWYKAAGLLRENRDDPKRGYASFQVWVYWLGDGGKRVAGSDGTLWVMNEQVDAPDWVQAVNNRAHTGPRAYLAPAGTRAAQIRFQLVTCAPDVAPKVWIDDVVFEDRDTAGQEGGMERTEIPLANAGFEEADGAGPRGWKPVGSAKTAWVTDPVHGGARAVSVSDAPMAGFSGWALDLPAEKNGAYAFSGWTKAESLAPYGPVGGAALCVQFLDKDGQALGTPMLSEAVPAGTGWKQVRTPAARPPDRAATVRLIAGLQFCKGTAWFDDVGLTVERRAASTAALIRRPNPQPSPGVTFATNLLANGDVEQGADNKPAHWTYVGKSAKDWTPAQIAAFYREGRPSFDIGRGQGEWSRDVAYAGKGALLNVSIDPPLSRNMQWYGRSPVTGYWLSDPMPCDAGMAYLAGAWIRPGAAIREPWFGPLEIQFFGEGGKTLLPRNATVRSGIGDAPAGVWTYWATLPFVAPVGAKTMRLRFGQELCAADGGWGRTYADNLAVWALPEGVSADKTQDHNGRTERFLTWFRQAHAKVKPPYLSAPTEAPEHQNCLGRVENGVPGNLYRDPAAEIPIKVAVSSQIGESRKVTLHIERFDWLGKACGAFDVPAFEVSGYSDGVTTVNLPPTRSCGAFYLECKIREGDAVVGEFAGRYAVLPPLERARTVENIWGVTTLVPFFGDGRPQEAEMGEMLKTAGFGIAWLNLSGTTDASFEKALREVEWWQSLGIRPVLRINHFDIQRPIDHTLYQELGKRIAAAFKGKVAAYGDWGVEQANHRTPQTPCFRPILGGTMLSDTEYDEILAGLHDGIKSVDRETPVLIGNIASDAEGETIRRLYGKPAEGRFDGAIFNAYMSILTIAQTGLREFDKHGDTKKTVWQEETADQRSPSVGPARRFGEAEGPKNMVRTWLTMKAVCGPRLKAMTMWGFAGAADDCDIMMVTPSLQPRPHFVAHAVMADALADATFATNLSQGNVTIFEWKRTDGPMFTIWANSGERSVTFDAPTGKLTVMDLMGNRMETAATDGVVSLKVTSSPVYVFGGGALTLSRRLETRLEQGSTKLGAPQVRLMLKNNGRTAIEGSAAFSGAIQGEAKQAFKVAPGETATLAMPVKSGLPADKRTSFTAECTTSKGAVYLATAGLNFAQAVRTPHQPAFDGTWSGWEAALVMAFGTEESQIFKGYGADVKYKGHEDISGKFRLLWDDRFLYLGVEATDDSFFPQPERGMSGFMGDSIEFAFQPDNRLERQAPYWEYELYLPGGQPPYAASRRRPAPAELITHWQATVKPTGQKGNCVYQAAIPWKDVGVTAPAAGKTISFALVLNDADVGERLSGGRKRVKWFDGIDMAKNPEGFGDVVLVAP